MLSIISGVGFLILRLVFTTIFLAHGLPKIKNLKGTGEWLAAQGFRPGSFWALILGLTETAGACAILVGFALPYVSWLFVIDMSVATLWKIRKGMGLKDGYELDVILLAVAVLFATNGGGIYSLDNYLRIF